MPGPAIPIWATVVVGAATASVVALITHFVTSSKAKARAAEYNEKVLRIVELLKQRLDNLEEMLCKARAEGADAENRAAEAERKAQRANDERNAEAAKARMERERAERARQAAEELERQLAAAQAEIEKWREESNLAERLSLLAGVTVTKEVVLEVRAISTSSLVLGGWLPKPNRTMEILNNHITEIERSNMVIEQYAKATVDALIEQENTPESFPNKRSGVGVPSVLTSET